MAHRNVVVHATGFKYEYEYGGHGATVVAAAYNQLRRVFVTADEKSVHEWDRSREHGVDFYAPHQYNLVRSIVFEPSLNCYFAVYKNTSIMVYTGRLEEVKQYRFENRNLLAIKVNARRMELIAVGAGIVQIWDIRRTSNFNKTNDVSLELVVRGHDKRGVPIPTEPPATLTFKDERWIDRVFLVQPYADAGASSASLNSRKFLDCIFALWDRSFMLIDCARGEVVSEWRDLHEHSLTAVLFYEPCNYIITASKDTTIKLWDLFTRSNVHTFKGHAKACTSLFMHPHDGLMVSCSLDCTIRMWNVETLEEVDEYRLNQIQGVTSMERIDDKAFLACCGSTPRVFGFNYVLGLFSEVRSPVISIHRSEAAFSPRNDLVALSQDGSFRIVDTDGSVASTTLLPRGQDKIESILPSPVERGIVYVFHVDHCISVFDIVHTSGGEGTHLFSYDLARKQNVLCADVSTVSPRCVRRTHATDKQGRRKRVVDSLARTGIDGGPSDEDVREATLRRKEEQAAEARRRAAEDDAPAFFVGGTKDGCALVWSAGTDPPSTFRSRWEAHKHPIVHVRWLPHSNEILTVSLSDEVKVWNPATLQARIAVHAHTGVQCSTFNHDNGLVLFGHLDGRVSLLDTRARDGHIVRPPPSSQYHSDCVTALDYAPELHLFISCSLDGVVKLWDEDGLRLVREVVTRQSLLSVAFVTPWGDFVLGVRENLSVVRVENYLPRDLLELAAEVREAWELDGQRVRETPSPSHDVPESGALLAADDGDMAVPRGRERVLFERLVGGRGLLQVVEDEQFYGSEVQTVVWRERERQRREREEAEEDARRAAAADAAAAKRKADEAAEAELDSESDTSSVASADIAAAFAGAAASSDGSGSPAAKRAAQAYVRPFIRQDSQPSSTAVRQAAASERAARDVRKQKDRKKRLDRYVRGGSRLPSLPAPLTKASRSSETVRAVMMRLGDAESASASDSTPTKPKGKGKTNAKGKSRTRTRAKGKGKSSHGAWDHDMPIPSPRRGVRRYLGEPM